MAASTDHAGHGHRPGRGADAANPALVAVAATALALIVAPGPACARQRQGHRVDTARAWLRGAPRRLAAFGGAGGVVMIPLGIRLTIADPTRAD